MRGDEEKVVLLFPQDPGVCVKPWNHPVPAPALWNTQAGLQMGTVGRGLTQVGLELERKERKCAIESLQTAHVKHLLKLLHGHTECGEALTTPSKTGSSFSDHNLVT